jgi:nucleoside phosphorylase
MPELEKSNQQAPGIDQQISQTSLEPVQPVETQPAAPRVTPPSSSHLVTRLDNNLIVTVTSVEAQAVLGAFSLQQKWSRKKIGGKTFYDLGIHGGSPTFMVQSEMGIATPGGSLLTVHQAIQCLQPQAVIMCGIAFGLRPDKQKLGDILIARQLGCYEPAKVMGLQTGNVSRGDRVTASNRLLERFRDADIDYEGPKRHFGLVLSGEKLVNDPNFLEQLCKLEPDAIGGEMEGAGLYVAASEEKVDWILVKAICDWADGSKDDSAQALAAKNAANFVLYALQLGDFRSMSSIDLPVNDGSAGAHKPKEDRPKDLQEQLPLTGDIRKESTIKRVMRESLPEAIGGLVVALVVGLMGLIYSQYPLLIKIVKNSYARIGPVWLGLIVLGILVAGISSIRITLRRKRGHVGTKKPRKGI